MVRHLSRHLTIFLQSALYFFKLGYKYLGPTPQTPPFIYPKSKICQFPNETGIEELQWEDIEVEEAPAFALTYLIKLLQPEGGSSLRVPV